MKKIYLMIFTCCTLAFNSNAQDPGISACLNGTNVQITFDLLYNCANAPGSLSGFSAIGFHSGHDGWADVIAWDSSAAVTASNDGADAFTWEFDPATYYANPVVSIINWVHNGGPVDTTNGGWANEGKTDDATATGCQDFSLDISSLATCSGSTDLNEVVLKDALNVSPNPANDFTNFNIILRNNKEVSIELFDLTGKLVDNVINSYFTKGLNTINYNSSELNSGIYIYKVISGDQVNSGKLTIK